MNAPFFPSAGQAVRELVIDSFAGGGGASTGIRMALGRDPDIAVNHDPLALAMHRANHPATRHMVQDVATVDSVGMCAGLPIGMLWMSPDCTDHSKAKGAAPRRDGDKTTRGIGWAIAGWVKALPEWQRPRIVFLENVEEYVDWGPLLPNGKRCPVRKGETFKAFVECWRALGYGAIEWRQRRAWKAGAGTIRRRLYMIMRRDGEPIVWPEPTHGSLFEPADVAMINEGKLKPWITAADSIDFSLPIPSIFETRAEIRRTLGIWAKRPLAPNTEARIAKGFVRHVKNAARPFMVKVNHTGRGGEARDRDLALPLTALTGKRDDALIAPFLAYAQQGGATRSAVEPTHTFTASRKDQNQLVAATMVEMYGHSNARQLGAPLSTVTQRDKHAVIAAFIAQHNGGPRPGAPGHPADAPTSTVTTTGAQQTLVAAHMLTLRGSDRRTAGADEPARTSSAQGNHHAVVSLPLMTVYYGTDEDGARVDAPCRTDTARARFGVVQAEAMPPPFSPHHEARARMVADFLRAHGCWDGGEFVTLDIDGVTFVVVDICMRMLTPRERYNANGFPRDYIIDHGIAEDGTVIPFTLEQQGYMCGNAVCPPEANALVGANYQPREVTVPRQRRRAHAAQVSMFLEAAE